MTLLVFVLICLAALAVIIVWNFVPRVREKLRGWTTVLEGVLAAGVYWFGQISDGLREAQQAGYLPSGWVQYIPYVLLVWMILKRLTTTSPAGKKV